MEETKSILHELYVFSEWKPEPEYLQKPDSLLPENISALWRWLKFFGPKKSLIDSVTAHKERQQKWHIALGDEGKVIAVLTDNILEIRTKRSEYATIAARTTVSRDAYSQWRKLVWSPDCSFVVVAYGNGIVSFYDLTASNLFNIPADCNRPGGLECTDNTHAVADVIFMPLRVKDNKWSWEVLVVTYDGRLRGYLVSQTDGFKLHHTFRFAGGVGAVTYCALHSTLYVAGLPRGPGKDPSSPLSAGITAWRILNDEPFYKLSVVCDQLEARLANQRFQVYIPFVSAKHLAFIVQMVLSPDASRLVCLHCNGDVSIWRLPLLKLLHRHPLASQPQHDLRSPLVSDKQAKCDTATFLAADVNWWSNEEIILSRFSGAVTVCNIENMVNLLGKKPEFFQGTPQVTCAHDGAFMALECESNVLPAKKSRSDESMEMVKIEEAIDDSMYELGKELLKSVLYAITDMETFQPKPRRITVVSRIYRLLGVKSTTPTELFSRKIESGSYSEALTLAETFKLDSDLVYQQQWRKNPVSTDAIQKYLSKVSKKIWAVHQCVDRLPETLPAAKELLQFGLELTNEHILHEINKDRDEDDLKDPDDIRLEDLNSYTSELLRCRHVMLFYKERLKLYESILKSEKSTYAKDEYDRLRSHSLVHSSIEIAKEGRIDALTCLWPNIKSVAMQLTVLEHLPETINPLEYQHLLPTKHPFKHWFDKKSPIKVKATEYEHDWCRKEIFRSIWSSNWSEDTTPESEAPAALTTVTDHDIADWYNKRAREIEERSGLASYALHLVTLATVGGGVEGLDLIMFHLLTLDTLIYDINVEGVTLAFIEKLSTLHTCMLLMKMSTPATFVADLKAFVIPFLKRYENLTLNKAACIHGLTDYLQNISTDDLSMILLVLQSPNEFELDVRTHLDLVERCLFAHTGTDQLEKAILMLDTILKESDGSISESELVRRVGILQKLVSGCERMARRGVKLSLQDLRAVYTEHPQAKMLLIRLSRTLALEGEKPSPQDWAELLKDLLELQSNLFLLCITKDEVYEIYASALLSSGDTNSIKLASDVLTCSPNARRGAHNVPYARSVHLVTIAAREYFNSASSLNDTALEAPRCCLQLIQEGNPEIEEELDLIASLQILSAFDLNLLPIQVRLCEDRMTLIEDCLKADPNAYLASHKLLKLAKLLRVSGNDEHLREARVLQLVGSAAINAGPAGWGAAADAARRLAALHHAPAAALLAHVARVAHAHADLDTRRYLLAAAAAHQPADGLEDVLTTRLALELEDLQPMAAALREQPHLSERWPSTDDEFDDAITTPVIEKKDLVAPPQPDKKAPLFTYLLDSIQSKFLLSDKSSSEDSDERTVHCPEFYRSLYPQHAAAGSCYGYARFTAPAPPPAARLLAGYYAHACLNHAAPAAPAAEPAVVQKCAEEILYKDTPLSVACMLRSTQDYARTKKLLDTHNTDTAVSATLYATLMKCNAPELRDNVYLTPPSVMAQTTLKQKNASQEQLEIIRECIDRLTGMGEVERLRRLGYGVNGLLFNADDDYRAETVYRVARSKEPEHVEAACSLGAKYGLSALDVWLQHAAAHAHAPLPPPAAATRQPGAHDRIKETLWPLIRGDDHSALINLFTILKGIDDKPPLFGLTAAEHIKLLKKVKAASSELDYKMLLEQPTADQYSAHLLRVLKPENVGMVVKLIRTLPPAFKPPLSVNALYTMWLTRLFFSVPPSAASNKKWMQQYRQCASYFNKLAKDDLQEFVANTCFTREAIERVPAGTRSLMIMQAVDYCQQEQENDFKFNKNEQTWAGVGQELSRWARFLDNFHSSTIQALVDGSGVPRTEIWPEIEMSHGDPDKVIEQAAALVSRGMRAGPLSSLLQCLVGEDSHRAFEHLARHANTLQDVETLVDRIMQYHKEGVKFPEELLESVMHAGSSLGLPPHKQIALLSLGRARVLSGDDLPRVARYTADLLRGEWPDLDYVRELTEEKLLTPEGRCEAFSTLICAADTWQRRKALVDALNCWPHTLNSDSRSLHCVYLESLLSYTSELKESLVLIKLLLRRPVLNEEEIKWVLESVHPAACVNALWTAALARAPPAAVLALLRAHKESFRKQEIDDELIKELLDSGIFIKLVSTPIYSSVINYIISRESSSDEASNAYTVSWAVEELRKANYLAEAGHLQFLAIGVPSPLRGFSQSIQYCKKMFSKKI
ncbi:neuroblastoma-amplified sequence-like [Ostrinia furnacalis]|uniref:neuroblastoma-amplified sequence-like n=1 Tax=Ostrinia furnacalis TaxID=93504 RepID=UPI00103E0293|nr:neuroblastoma-amplified sequence-like [Ostrinia furnacalis]